jgi:hypothetical protein
LHWAYFKNQSCRDQNQNSDQQNIQKSLHPGILIINSGKLKIAHKDNEIESENPTLKSPFFSQ